MRFFGKKRQRVGSAVPSGKKPGCRLADIEEFSRVYQSGGWPVNLIPAIDVLDGKVVRLFKGDPSRSKVYSDDPVRTAVEWARRGAPLLHVVDLSAALGRGENTPLVRSLSETVSCPVQTGGGIRSKARARLLLEGGIARVIVGTKSLDRQFLSELVEEFGPDRIGVGIDVRGGQVAVKGWTEDSGMDAERFLETVAQAGIQWVVYTDISRDGTLQGPDIEKVSALRRFSQMKLIFSGGISSSRDLEILSRDAPFLWGVIAGKALYERTIDPEKMKFLY
ncbi:MAG: 1-(5-phosphoribosyl)-5-[(5-phosphoribosylamino)methylideneamino]imidazole-4-carboxamide isomerase [Candidatus Omnitrophica bacterium]|nr:1-(5-phosphoribosyl)-5-[(5-phosphoribosylamino)methylideneamino]imidazole-4-carboxamide isomerase [Candidatus Omnitrophota bacterium]